MLSALKKTTPATGDFFTFDLERMRALAEQHHAAYQSNQPFPHIMFDGLLPEDAAQRIVAEFPTPDHPAWFTRTGEHEPNKQGTRNAEKHHLLPPFIHSVLQAFNSYPFIDFLERLTGIHGLIPDPHFLGGGLHQILPGGKLDVHADFNHHDHIDMYRKLNVLLYLNDDWDEAWGGHLELWDKDMKTCAKKIAPLLNRCVVFSTSKYSYHGHPLPLECPEGQSRKSMAFYFYTPHPREGEDEHHITLWQERPDVP